MAALAERKKIANETKIRETAVPVHSAPLDFQASASRKKVARVRRVHRRCKRRGNRKKTNPVR